MRDLIDEHRGRLLYLFTTHGTYIGTVKAILEDVVQVTALDGRTPLHFNLSSVTSVLPYHLEPAAPRPSAWSWLDAQSPDDVQVTPEASSSQGFTDQDREARLEHYWAMTKKELIAVAKAMGMKGYSSMNKETLVHAIVDMELGA